MAGLSRNELFLLPLVGRTGGFDLAVLRVVKRSFQFTQRIIDVHKEKISSYSSFQIEADRQKLHSTNLAQSGCFLMTGSYDKSLRLFRLDPSSLIFEPFRDFVFKKKLAHAFFSEKKQALFAADKYGDVFSLRKEQLFDEEQKEFEYVTSCMASAKCFKELAQRNCVVFCDQFSKMKVFPTGDFQRLANVVIPIEGQVKQLLEFDKFLIFLIKVKNAPSLSCDIVVFRMSEAELFFEGRGEEIFRAKEASALLVKAGARILAVVLMQAPKNRLLRFKLDENSCQKLEERELGPFSKA